MSAKIWRAPLMRNRGVFPTSPNWVLRKWVSGAGNIRKFRDGPAEILRIPARAAKFWRSVTFRSVPRCVFFVFGGFAFPIFPIWVLVEGVSCAEIIEKFWTNPPKYGGPQGAVAKC